MEIVTATNDTTLATTGAAMLAMAETPKEYADVAAFASVARAAARKKKETGLANLALGVMLKAEMGLADEVDAGQAAGTIAKSDSGNRNLGFGVGTLNDVGVTGKQVHEGRKIRDHFKGDERRVDAIVDAAGEDDYLARLSFLTVHVGQNSGDNEWYTPASFIDAAVQVMGAIDVDPASSIAANATIGAATFYTQDDNGLDHSWQGRVFLNPPYAKGLVELFIDKLIDEYLQDRCTEAIVLTNNATEVKWFQRLHIAQAICFVSPRIAFVKPGNSETATGLQGQTFHYLGGNADRFVAEFGQHGRTHKL